MRAYTANELQALVDAAWRRGLDDGRNFAPDVILKPPRLVELIDHPVGNQPVPRATRRVPFKHP